MSCMVTKMKDGDVMIMKIDFNVPPYTGDEDQYIEKAIKNRKICGDGEFTKKCNEWMKRRFGAQSIMLTTSGTAALDMAVLMCGLNPNDEVILPSYTFSSTANAVILGGGVPVFVDIRPDTMNIDEKKIENAITERTKAIVTVHYAGVSCEMDAILRIADKYGLIVIEDAAQAVMSSYDGKFCGTIGTFGCYSFHETKNFSMGEGGAIVVRSPEYIEQAEILREKGTDRSKFYRGQVDKYTWVDKGDSYLPSELNAAYLYPQLLKADEITRHRLECWDRYYENLSELADEGKIDLPVVPDKCKHNGHMFYIKVKDLNERTELMKYLRNQGISTAFHYIPLHSAPAGRKYGRFSGEDEYTTREAERLLRLPLHYDLNLEQVEEVTRSIKSFYYT